MLSIVHFDILLFHCVFLFSPLKVCGGGEKKLTTTTMKVRIQLYRQSKMSGSWSSQRATIYVSKENHPSEPFDIQKTEQMKNECMFEGFDPMMKMKMKMKDQHLTYYKESMGYQQMKKMEYNRALHRALHRPIKPHPFAEMEEMEEIEEIEEMERTMKRKEMEFPSAHNHETIDVRLTWSSNSDDVCDRLTIEVGTSSRSFLLYSGKADNIKDLLFPYSIRRSRSHDPSTYSRTIDTIDASVVFTTDETIKIQPFDICLHKKERPILVFPVRKSAILVKYGGT